jgi:hypothetical protein
MTTLTRTLRPLKLYTTQYTAIRTMSQSRGGSSIDPKASIDGNAPTFGMQQRQPTAEEKALIDDVLQLCE